jgi:Eph receptor B1
MLTWDPPLDEGGRSDTQYKVECDVCSSLITFSPASPSSQSSVTLSHLQQGTTYTIRVFSINGVSNLSLENDNYAEVSVSTGSGAPSVVSNLMISDKKPHQVAEPNGLDLTNCPKGCFCKSRTHFL